MSSDEIRRQLAAPFPPDEIGWKPQTVKGNRALAVAYIDARNVEDRLDDVFGPAGWQDEYTPLPGGQVMCRLSCFVNEQWVAKSDVGGESEQPDGGDRVKAAFSDALKRAAVKWGIGRYLYELPKQWCDFDPVKKQFTHTPQLPPKFRPQVPAKAVQSTATNGQPVSSGGALAPTTDDLFALIQQLAAIENRPEADVIAELFRAMKVDAASLDDLTDSQVQAAYKAVTGRIEKARSADGNGKLPGMASEPADTSALSR